MRLIKPSFEIKEQETGLNGVYKQIEWAGRHCYKSLDKITEDSAKKFADMLANNKHGAMLEHGTVYLKVLLNNELVLEDAYGENNSASAYIRYMNNKYSKVNCRDGLENVFITDTVEPGYAYITTNFRVLVENGWLEDLQYLCEPTEHHAKRITVKFTTDQGVMREFTRHRVFSFACESTRYCNYSKSKFGGDITYIIPNWCDNITEGAEIYPIMDAISTTDTRTIQEREFLAILQSCETGYLQLLEMGWKPQQARNVLPLATKCDLIMTGFVSDWNGFFELRCSNGAHPQAKELADTLKSKFIELGIYEN